MRLNFALIKKKTSKLIIYNEISQIVSTHIFDKQISLEFGPFFSANLRSSFEKITKYLSCFFFSRYS